VAGTLSGFSSLKARIILSFEVIIISYQLAVHSEQLRLLRCARNDNRYDFLMMIEIALLRSQ